MKPLPWGRFFGGSDRVLRTPTFQFADRVALVPDREVPRHSHADAHLVLVVRGTYITEAHDGAGHCGAGSVIFNPRGTEHRDRFRTDRGRFLSVSLDGGIAELIENNHRGSTRLRRTDVAAAVWRARRELSMAGDLSDLVLESLGHEIAALLTGRNRSSDGGAPPWLARIRERLHDECAGRPSLAELAQTGGVHPMHVARAFRRHFGSSPGEYQRRCRVHRARSLLPSDMPLAEVAAATGFCDQSQLTHAFRRVLGTTPAACRRALQVSISQEEDAWPMG